MTLPSKPRVLIVDDDEAICKTLSAILQSEDYETTTATTAKEAIEKARTHFFNLALLDIKLPDMEGTQLLLQLQGITPEMIKIMVTGYPSLKNAVEALNFGASSYIMKPIDPAELLATIKNKLEAQQQTEKITTEKLAKWIHQQARKAQSSDFKEFLEQTAKELAAFGLTKTQAKTYVTLLALGVASASEIAATSKIRREEVYRMLPLLEKRGLVLRVLKSPRKFTPIEPEMAIQRLVKTKLRAMETEISRLSQEQHGLVSKLREVELPVLPDNCSVDIITDHDNVVMKLLDMTQKAERQIDIVAPFEELRNAYANRPKDLREKLLRTVKIRGIVGNNEFDSLTKDILQSAETKGNPIELRRIEKLPFHLFIVDDREAMWGGLSKRKVAQDFWTNDPNQISILKMSFDNLWQKSGRKKEVLQKPTKTSKRVILQP